MPQITSCTYHSSQGAFKALYVSELLDHLHVKDASSCLLKIHESIHYWKYYNHNEVLSWLGLRARSSAAHWQHCAESQPEDCAAEILALTVAQEEKSLR